MSPEDLWERCHRLAQRNVALKNALDEALGLLRYCVSNLEGDTEALELKVKRLQQVRDG